MQTAGESILDHLNWCTPFLAMRSKRKNSANLWLKLQDKQEHVNGLTQLLCLWKSQALHLLSVFAERLQNCKYEL